MPQTRRRTQRCSTGKIYAPGAAGPALNAVVEDEILALLCTGAQVSHVAEATSTTPAQVIATGQACGMTYYPATAQMLYPQEPCQGPGPEVTPLPPDFFQSGETTPEGESWQDRALCAQTDPEAFFPEKGGSTREPKKICRACDVRTQCLEYALEHDERFGIWGGLSERERRRLKREQVAA